MDERREHAVRSKRDQPPTADPVDSKIEGYCDNEDCTAEYYAMPPQEPEWVSPDEWGSHEPDSQSHSQEA